MNSQSPMTRPLIFSAMLALATAAGAAGCSDSGDDGGNIQEPCDGFSAADVNPILTPRHIFTGTDGTHPYKAVISTNFGNVEFFSNDTSVVTAERIGCLEAGRFGPTGLLTAVGAGEATITVVSVDRGQDVDVTVTAYTPEQYTLGEQRYNNPANGNQLDRLACGTCHLGQGGAPHDPLALASRTDAELVAATTLGKYADTCSLEDNTLCNCTPDALQVGNECGACPESGCTFAEGYILDLAATGGGVGDHLFNLTPDEEIAIMAFMRALPPEGI